MKLFVILVLVSVVVAALETFDRENEPDPNEFKPFRMSDLIRDFCRKVRYFLEEKTHRGEKPRNAKELSSQLIAEFDSSKDNCISNDEIRDIAARFRGDLTGYRTLFQHVLDENRNGCVEEDELNALILDCIMPSATWMKTHPEKYMLPFDEEERYREIVGKAEPVEDNTVEEEEGEEEPIEMENDTGVEGEETYQSVEIKESTSTDRRRTLEQQKIKEAALRGLNPAIKEMICSIVRKQSENTEYGIKHISNIVDVDGDQQMSFNEFYEFLSGARVPREESDDIATIIDADKDSIITSKEIIEAVNGCPRPEIKDVPVVNTRPMIVENEVPCPSERAMYGYLRKIAMKFIGRQGLPFTDVRDAALQMYIAITGNIEKVVSPKDLDVPISCVKESWRDIDRNQDGFLDLQEFEQLAFDILEEFIPRKVKAPRYENTRIDVESAVPVPAKRPLLGADEVLNRAVYSTLKEMGKRVPDSDMRMIVDTLREDPDVTALLKKVEGVSTKEANERLNSAVRQVVLKMLRRD